MSYIYSKTEVNIKKISCGGGTGAEGHPMVFLNLGNEDEIICLYCSKKFILRQQ